MNHLALSLCPRPHTALCFGTCVAVGTSWTAVGTNHGMVVLVNASESSISFEPRCKVGVAAGKICSLHWSHDEHLLVYCCEDGSSGVLHVLDAAVRSVTPTSGLSENIQAFTAASASHQHKQSLIPCDFQCDFRGASRVSRGCVLRARL